MGQSTNRAAFFTFGKGVFVGLLATAVAAMWWAGAKSERERADDRALSEALAAQRQLLRLKGLGQGARDVPVAAMDIAAGTVVSENVVSRRAVPAEMVTESVVPLDLVERLNGVPITVDMRAGDLLLWSHLQRQLPALSARLAEGQRLYTLPVNPAGWVGAGDRVDVIAASAHGARTAMEDLLVLAVQGPRDSAGGTVTLALTPRDAEQLAQLEAQGLVRLAVRGAQRVAP